MICPVPGRENIYYQVGITAWGLDCGLKDVPGVYANVIKFRGWIDQRMKELRFGIGSYTMKHS